MLLLYIKVRADIGFVYTDMMPPPFGAEAEEYNLVPLYKLTRSERISALSIRI